METVKLYYRPSCAYSIGAVSFLVLRGADFSLLNLEQDPGQAERLSQRLGKQPLETPTFEVGGNLWVAPKLSQLQDLLKEWGLPDDAAPHQQLKQSK